MKNFWNVFVTEIEKTQGFFLDLVKNPLEAVRNLPDWAWPTVLLTHFFLAAGSGLVAGIVDFSFIRILLGVLVYPIKAAAVIVVSVFFLSYSSQLFFQKGVELKSLVILLVAASVPYHVFQVLSPLLPPIDVLAFAFTGILVIVGMVDTFHTPKSGTIRLVFLMWGIFLVMWSLNQYMTHVERKMTQQFAPRSFEEMKKDIEESL